MSAGDALLVACMVVAVVVVVALLPLAFFYLANWFRRAFNKVMAHITWGRWWEW